MATAELQKLFSTLAIAGNLGEVQRVKTIRDVGVFREDDHVEVKWDPAPLISELCSDLRPNPAFAKEPLDCQGSDDIEMAGVIEKLPVNALKPTLLKGWKKRYVRCHSGNLFYYEDNRSNQALGCMKLQHGKVFVNTDKTFRVSDRTGSFCIFKCGSQAEAEDWGAAIKKEVEAFGGKKESKSTVIIDIGSCITRAGFAHDEAYPEVCFPSVVAYGREAKDESNCVYGHGALKPEVREKSVISHPFRPSLRVDKFKFKTDHYIGLILHAYAQLGVEPTDFKLIATLPQNTSKNDKEDLVAVLIDTIKVPAVYLSEQSVLAMYSYRLTTGIVVDIGDRMDIVPIVDGFIVESGVTRFPFGGRTLTENMARFVAEEGYRYFSEMQSYMMRYIKERAAYVAEDFEREKEACDADPSKCSESVDCRRFKLPDGTLSVKINSSRFHASEGLFNPNIWGIDSVGLHHHVNKAIKAAGIDVRRLLCRSILLSGGTTMIPGLAKRLQSELSSLLPSSMQVQVLADENRQYAAYNGASVLACLSAFDEMCIWAAEWQEMGADALKKWG